MVIGLAPGYSNFSDTTTNTLFSRKDLQSVSKNLYLTTNLSGPDELKASINS